MNKSKLTEISNEQKSLNARLSNVEFAVNFVDVIFCHDFDRIIALFAPMSHLAKEFRVGSLSDGGYVICEPLSEHPRIISLGLGFEVSAEAALLELGWQTIAADGSVENPFPNNSNFRFLNSHITSHEIPHVTTRTFNEFVGLFGWDTAVEVIKIDIEGGEYNLLLKNLSNLQHARQLVIEFHGLELLGDQKFRDILIDLLENLHQTHKPIHVHGNNGAPGIKMAGGEWPTLLEVTFLRKDECTDARNFGPFPSALDFPNTSLRPDIDLNPFFAPVPTYLQLVKLISSTLDLV